MINIIDLVFSIQNMKLADLDIFLSSCTQVSSFYNFFDWPMPLLNQVEAIELMSNLLNLVSLYCKFVNELKT